MTKAHQTIMLGQYLVTEKQPFPAREESQKAEIEIKLTCWISRGAISFLDKKRSRFKHDILSRKDARLYIFLTVFERKHSEVSESAKILSVSAPELILQAKPR